MAHLCPLQQDDNAGKVGVASPSGSVGLGGVHDMFLFLPLKAKPTNNWVASKPSCRLLYGQS